jgi:UDP-GlcNAc:undecaprenyl-phosphate/decaprenyl-phosphate GlcNAc-1-phosphate transferase
MVDGARIAMSGGVAFVVVAILVPLARRIALRQGITDDPAPGKSHASPTPYLGGVAIALGALICSLVLPGWQSEAAVILAAAALVSVTGFFDDLRTVRPSMRLLVEATAAGAAAAAGAHVQLFDNPLDYVITVVWIVVITNSFNLLDNMDAAAGSIATVIASALAVTALMEGQQLVGGLAVVVAAACLAFLIYNWHPARIFMGDAGSLFLGFLLAVISLKLRTPVPHAASIVAVVLLVGPAVFDTTLVVISRASHGRRIFIGGTDHTSHRLLLLGVPRAGVTAVLVGATTASCTLGILVAEGTLAPEVAVPVALVPALGMLVFLLRMGVYSDDGRSRGQLTIRPSPVRSDRPPAPRPRRAELRRVRSRVHESRATSNHPRGR